MTVASRIMAESVRMPRIRPIITSLHVQIAIPYHKLYSTSENLKYRMVKALEITANNMQDERNAAACYELCLCYISGFGTATDHTKAAVYLIRACERGHLLARSGVHRLLDSIGTMSASKSNARPVIGLSFSADDFNSQHVDRNQITDAEGPSAFVNTIQSSLSVSSGSKLSDVSQVDSWLESAVSQGYLVALESLQERQSPLYPRALATYRKLEVQRGGSEPPIAIDWPELCVVLDDLKKEGSPTPEVLAQLAQSERGGPLLIRAMRAGRHDAVLKLLDVGVNSQTCNAEGENALHFLCCLDESEVDNIAGKLFETGIDWTQEAQTCTIPMTLDPRSFICGCPMVRATILRRPKVLATLFGLETAHEGRLTVRQTKRKENVLRRILGFASQFCYIDILQVLSQYRRDSLQRNFSGTIYWKGSSHFGLTELVLFGPSDIRSGPQRSRRCRLHGRAYLESLRQTLYFLQGIGIDLKHTPCRGDTNALFAAISLGSQDAAKILLEDFDDNKKFAVFGTTEAEDIDQHPNHRRKEGLVRATILAIEKGDLEMIRMFLQTRDREALKMGAIYPVISDNDALKSSFTIPTPRSSIFQSIPQDVRSLFPDCGNALYRYDDCWKFFLRSRRNDDFFISDGRLNYRLRYMAEIARSKNRSLLMRYDLPTLL